MTVILWLCIIAAFVLAFIGLIKPIIPSVLVLWVGFLIYQFGFHNGNLSWVFYVSMILFTVFILVADFIMNKYFVNKFGGCTCRCHRWLFCLSTFWHYYSSICCSACCRNDSRA